LATVTLSSSQTRPASDRVENRTNRGWKRAGKSIETIETVWAAVRNQTETAKLQICPHRRPEYNPKRIGQK